MPKSEREGWESRNVKLPDATWDRLRKVADERMVGHGLILAKAIDHYLDLLEKQDPLQAPPKLAAVGDDEAP